MTHDQRIQEAKARVKGAQLYDPSDIAAAKRELEGAKARKKGDAYLRNEK